METIIGTARPIHPSSWGLNIAVVFAVRSVCTFVYYMDAYAANAPLSAARRESHGVKKHVHTPSS